MGQYFLAASLTSDKKNVKSFIYPHDIKSKYKREDGTSFTVGSGAKLMEHSYLANPFLKTAERMLIPGGPWHKTPIVWAGDYADAEEGSERNLHDMTENGSEGEHISIKLKPKPLTIKEAKEFRFIVNHTTKQFVDKNKVKKFDGNFQLHPLSLLTADGNGRGGGDYRGESELIGIWARNIISIEKEIPNGFTELNFDLIEE